MASLRRVHLGGQDAEMIRSMVRNKTRGATLPAEKGVRRVGITTFIGATLRDNVPYSPRRRPGSRAECRSGEALKRGRRCHRMVEEFVETGKVPLPPAPSRSKQVDLPKTWARSIIRVLQQANIEPLRAEVPGCLGSIRTQIDLLGMRRRPDREIELCVIELKTTSKTVDGHAQSYDDVCTKLAAFEFAGNKMRNTERNGHHIQAAFGPHALVNQWPMLCQINHLTPYVLVATTTNAVLYKVPSLPAAAYAVECPAAKGRSRRLSVSGFEKLPVGRDGQDIRNALKQAGHAKITRCARASCATTFAGRKCAVGIVSDEVPSGEQLFKIKKIAADLPKFSVACLVHRDVLGGWNCKIVI